METSGGDLKNYIDIQDHVTVHCIMGLVALGDIPYQ